MNRRAAAMALALLLMPTPAAAGLPEGYALSAQMRDTGYVLGDLLEQRIEIAAPRTATLEASSIPKPGRVNHWMDLRDSRVERDAGGYTLTLRYQVFGAVESALQLAVPAFQLKLTEGSRSVVLPVAPQPFYLSPVLPATLSDDDRRPRPSLAPAPLPEARWLAGAGLSALLAALLALALAWAYDRLPFLPRSPGPLTALFRKLRRRGAALDGSAYVELLRQVQSAFNHCARETLYAENLPLLFARAPWLQPLRADIEALFLHSRQVFYGTAPQPGAWPAAQVIALCRQARDCERGLK